MKAKIFTLAAVVAAISAACALTGCAEQNNGELKANGNVSLTVALTAKTEVTEITDSTSLKDYMDALAQNGELIFDGENGSYGYYVKSIFGLNEYSISSTPTSSEGYSWSLYIDFTALDGDEAVYASDHKTFNYNDTVLYYANYGASGVPCVAGHTYTFVYEYYNFSW